MTKYYFLSSFMPVQSPDGEAVFSLADLDDLLVTNLSREDWIKYQLIKRLFDLENFAFFGMVKRYGTPLGKSRRKMSGICCVLSNGEPTRNLKIFLKISYRCIKVPRKDCSLIPNWLEIF